MINNQLITFLSIILAVLILCSLIGVYIFHAISKNKKIASRLEKFKTSVLFEVKVPRDNEIEIDAADHMFTGLYSVYKDGLKHRLFNVDEYISFEIVGLPEEIHFFIQTPSDIKDLVEKTLNASYPCAEIKIVEDYNIFSPNSSSAFCEMKLSKSSFYPIQVYDDLKVDTLFCSYWINE